MKFTRQIIGRPQLQALDHLGHYCRRLECQQLVVYIRTRLKKAKLRKGLHTRRDGIAFGILLNQYRCRARINRRGTQQIQHRYTTGHHERYNEPFPFGQTQVKQVLNAQKIICLLILGSIFIDCHIKILFYD